MSKLFLISVGKIKSSSPYLKIQEEFIKRVNSPKIQLIETKSFGEDFEKESNEVVQKIKNLSSKPYIILMDEFGEKIDSVELSTITQSLLDTNNDLFFVIGGAKGHSSELKKFANKKISLSKMTFPHKLARIIVLEQIYRAQSIQSNHPYHNP